MIHIKRFTNGMLVFAALVASSAWATEAVVYKSPSCGCCSEWVKHMEENGITVKIEDTVNLHPIKKELGITPAIASCHTAVIDGYIFEGHIPAVEIKRFLAEQPDAKGLAVPRMPAGSPGMTYDDRRVPYQVLSFKDDGTTSIYASYGTDGKEL